MIYIPTGGIRHLAGLPDGVSVERKVVLYIVHTLELAPNMSYVSFGPRCQGGNYGT